MLWLKELSLLFGSTAYAASTTLAVFFLGLAVGGAVFGRWSPRLRSPLRAYAWLELGIAAAAALYFVLLEVYFQLYGPVYDALVDRPAAFNAFRIALATLVLLPPAALMGGTLPVLGQHLVRRPHELGRHGSRLYAVNTIGAASGAFLAGFVLPPALGFDRAYLLAMAVNVAVAGIAWRWSRIDEGGAGRDPELPDRRLRQPNDAAEDLAKPLAGRGCRGRGLPGAAGAARHRSPAAVSAAGPPPSPPARPAPRGSPPLPFSPACSRSGSRSCGRGCSPRSCRTRSTPSRPSSSCSWPRWRPARPSRTASATFGRRRPECCGRSSRCRGSASRLRPSPSTD